MSSLTLVNTGKTKFGVQPLSHPLHRCKNVLNQSRPWHVLTIEALLKPHPNKEMELYSGRKNGYYGTGMGYLNHLAKVGRKE
jgi:hypothetical protein